MNMLATTRTSAYRAERDSAWLQGKEGEVFTRANILTRVERTSDLAHKDASRVHRGAAIDLHTTVLWV